MKNQDLFLDKKDILFDCLKHLGIFSSVTVLEIGLKIHYTLADHKVREWVKQGKVRILDSEEIKFRGLRKKGQALVAWYEIV